ncbi:MAG TPA: hypothetical protein VL961_11560, partial [Acidimicrobiales bacterium]|nr:hypothetical protein [Acidimicrobiales bacterium]
ALVTYRREIDGAPDPRAAARELSDAFAGGAEPWGAARLAYVDDVIDPARTRDHILRALATGTVR